MMTSSYPVYVIWLAGIHLRTLAVTVNFYFTKNIISMYCNVPLYSSEKEFLQQFANIFIKLITNYITLQSAYI